jgi:DNA-binding transcriptional LysR family regulator
VLDRRDPENPRQCSRQFTLACADNQQICDAPQIAEAMTKHMPRARLRVVSIDYLVANDGLARGGVDVAIGPNAAPPGSFCAELYRERGVAVVRRNHPRVEMRMTRELFNSSKHVDTLITLGQAGAGHNLAEKFFRRHGLVRNVVLSVPSFTAAAMIAVRTDCVACLPGRIAQALGRYLPLRILEVPARGFEMPLNLHWHSRTHADASAQYFRDLIISTLRDRPPARRTRATPGRAHQC